MTLTCVVFLVRFNQLALDKSVRQLQPLLLCVQTPKTICWELEKIPVLDYTLLSVAWAT